MRRRRAPGVAPLALVVFEGFRYQTSTAWSAAFGEFMAARAAWAEAHEVAVLPSVEIKGDCPFDYSRFRKSAAAEITA